MITPILVGRGHVNGGSIDVDFSDDALYAPYALIERVILAEAGGAEESDAVTDRAKLPEALDKLGKNLLQAQGGLRTTEQGFIGLPRHGPR